jgi:hypothetical protein
VDNVSTGRFGVECASRCDSLTVQVTVASLNTLRHAFKELLDFFGNFMKCRSSSSSTASRFTTRLSPVPGVATSKRR